MLTHFCSTANQWNCTNSTVICSPFLRHVFFLLSAPSLYSNPPFLLLFSFTPSSLNILKRTDFSLNPFSLSLSRDVKSSVTAAELAKWNKGGLIKPKEGLVLRRPDLSVFLTTACQVGGPFFSSEAHKPRCHFCHQHNRCRRSAQEQQSEPHTSNFTSESLFQPETSRRINQSGNNRSAIG